VNSPAQEDRQRARFYADRERSATSTVPTTTRRRYGASNTRTHLSPSGYSADCPDWSPDGTRIAFSGEPTTGTALTGVYVMKADGSDQPRRLTPETTSSYCPVWSPEGTKLAYHSGATGAAEIFVVNADGSGQQVVAPSPGQDEFPSWSPDGRHLAFASDRDGHPGVYVVQLGSSTAPQLVTGTDGGGYPRWRPY
jgi:Tol biopolymer transport system component